MGSCKAGVAKVLSTASFAPASWAILAMAAMSKQRSRGFVGDSIHTNLVLASTSFPKAVGDGSSVNTGTSPKPSNTRLSNRNVPPYRSRSEEHTSELQSRLHLVCHLLLSKNITLDPPTLDNHRQFVYNQVDMQD